MLRPIPTPRDPRTYAILGAAFEVHRVMGAGFKEIFYKDALALEFSTRAIPYAREAPCVIHYKGCQLRGEHHMDFVCYGEVVLEVKARASIGPADHAQVLTYLASTRLGVGLLLNMGGAKLEYKRFIWAPDGRPIVALNPVGDSASSAPPAVDPREQ